MKSLILTALTMLVTQAAYAAPDYVQIIPHQGICNEVRLVGNESGSIRWGQSSAGGRFSITEAGFKDLQINEMRDVTFGKQDSENRLTFRFHGPALVATSLRPPGRDFGVSYNSLHSDKSKSIIGKASVLYEADRSKWLKDPSADFGSRMPILQATLYVNQKHPADRDIVGCKYVAGDVDLKSVRDGSCIWIDSNSKASNGLPYCW